MLLFDDVLSHYVVPNAEVLQTDKLAEFRSFE